MVDSAINVVGLGKEYEINAAARRHDSLREAITQTIRTPFSRRSEPVGAARPKAGHFWALRDVDFSVKPGEVLGVIGRNGAGKSTLLKILARITAPSTGRIALHGRVGSLLEVGTGFNHELTGRENIFLNGAILGMTRAEIQRKFDDIVEFAEVKAFLDTPVKRYSSGMGMRLAFAVAANLEPEILLVDEVLAVGDIDFQKKCLGRMKTLAGGDRTVILVSHNMAAIQSLCNRCLLLDKGRVMQLGPTSEVVAKYAEIHAPSGVYVRSGPPSADPYISRAEIRIEPETRQSPYRLKLKTAIVSPRRMRASLGLRIGDQIGSPIAYASLGLFSADDMIDLAIGENEVSVAVPLNQMALGEYTLSLRLSVPSVALFEMLNDCLKFSVERAPEGGETRALVQAWGYGCVQLPAQRVIAAEQRVVPAAQSLASIR